MDLKPSARFAAALVSCLALGINSSCVVNTAARREDHASLAAAITGPCRTLENVQ